MERVESVGVKMLDERIILFWAFTNHRRQECVSNIYLRDLCKYFYTLM